jgi:hypothetical protein
MDKLNQINKNPNDISRKLQILKQFLKENNKSNFSEFNKKFNILNKDFRESSNKNKKYLENLNSEIDNLIIDISNIILEETQNFKNTDSLFKYIKNILKESFIDTALSIPKMYLEMNPELKVYIPFLMSAFNFGVVNSKSIFNSQSETSEQSNHLSNLPEITAFIKKDTKNRFYLTILNDDKLNHKITNELSLKNIFQSLGSDYLTENEKFNDNKYNIKVDFSQHNELISVVLIFPEKISYQNGKNSQIFQFIGKFNNKIYTPIRYTMNNKYICEGNKNDYCILNSLKNTELSQIKDYKHQIILSNDSISTIHTHQNQRKITYISGFKNLLQSGKIDYHKTQNPLNLAFNSTNTLPEISIDENNQQILINNKKCFDFSLNSIDCIDLSTSTQQPSLPTNQISSLSSSKTTPSITKTTTQNFNSTVFSTKPYTTTNNHNTTTKMNTTTPSKILTTNTHTTNAQTTNTITTSITSQNLGNSTSGAIEQKKENSSINSLYFILPGVLLSLSAVGYFTIKFIRRKNYTSIHKNTKNKAIFDSDSSSVNSDDSDIIYSRNLNDYGASSTSIFSVNSAKPILPKTEKIPQDKNKKSWFNLPLLNSLYAKNSNIYNDNLQMENLETAETSSTTLTNQNPANNQKQIEYDHINGTSIPNSVTENEKNRKELLRSPDSKKIQVQQLSSQKEEREKQLQQVQEHKIFIQNFIYALQTRIDLREEKKNELSLPDCKFMKLDNSKYKKYFLNDTFNYEIMYKLFPGKNLYCENNHEIEKKLNQIYKMENEQMGKMKSSIIDDLYIMLFDKSSKWYKTEIYKNNQENEILEILKRIQEQIIEKESNLIKNKENNNAMQKK